MPKNLTDENSWETVAVPIGTDPATAASVETPFQLLADRTWWLLNFIWSHCVAYLNLNAADVTSISTLDLTNVMAGCIRGYKTGVRDHTIIDNDGQTALCQHPGKATPTNGGGGVLWDDEAQTPGTQCTWTAAGTRVDICGSWSDSATLDERCAVSNSAVDQVAYSAALDTWANAASRPAGVLWSACEYAYPDSELWAIGGASGALATSTNISTTAFVSRTSGLTGAVVRIRSNRKKSSTDHAFLALDDAGNVSISNALGTSWTATLVASLGLTSTIESIAWDRVNDRWVGIQYNGMLAWSENGTTWTEGAAALLPDFTQDAGNNFYLDCDDQGNLVLGIYRASPARALIYVAPDGGNGLLNDMVWQEAFWPGLYNHAKILFMGHGRVITAGAGGVLYSDAGFGTRWEQ